MNTTRTNHNHGELNVHLAKQTLKEYEYRKTNDSQVRYLLAPDSEHAAWAAAELSGGSQFVLDVRLCDEW